MADKIEASAEQILAMTDLRDQHAGAWVALVSGVGSGAELSFEPFDTETAAQTFLDEILVTFRRDHKAVGHGPSEISGHVALLD